MENSVLTIYYNLGHIFSTASSFHI